MNPEEDISWREKVGFYVRVHHRLRSGIRRLRGGWWQIFQTAVAAGAAWFMAFLILGRERPDFAPIAAVISLGLAVGERGRRTVELVLGVAFGAAIASLLVFVIGLGPVQIGAESKGRGEGEKGVDERPPPKSQHGPLQRDPPCRRDLLRGSGEAGHGLAASRSGWTPRSRGPGERSVMRPIPEPWVTSHRT